MVELLLPKQTARVRFPSSARKKNAPDQHWSGAFLCAWACHFRHDGASRSAPASDLPAAPQPLEAGDAVERLQTFAGHVEDLGDLRRHRVQGPHDRQHVASTAVVSRRKLVVQFGTGFEASGATASATAPADGAG